MASRHSYALIAAGSVGRTLIGKLPAKSVQIGPVAGMSFRVASRIANSLKAGQAVRGLADLNGSSRILFHAPSDQIGVLLDYCFSSPLDWEGRTVVFCDCEPPSSALSRLEREGASTAVVRSFGVPGFLAIDGDPLGLPQARKIVRDIGLRPIEIAKDRAGLFRAALMLGTAAVTPLVDRAAYLFRCAGIRDGDSNKLAEMLFEQTIRGYARSGRQSWAWHTGAPPCEDLQSAIAALESPLGHVIRQALLLGLETFEKHPDLADALRTAGDCS